MWRCLHNSFQCTYVNRFYCMYAHITNTQTHIMYVHMYIPTSVYKTHSYTNPCRHSLSPRMYVVSSLQLLYHHRPLQSHAFIPYSHWLGGILRDIHRVLLLAASTEGNSKTLVQILKVHIYCMHISTNIPIVVQWWVCIKCC